MSIQDEQILGQAVFGTLHGLRAYGNGILAGADSTPGVFEFGRSRNDPLHDCELEKPAAAFCRRIAAEAHDVEVDLVGVVAPSKDEQGRSGFFGGCVAIRTDRVRNQKLEGWFGNWTLLEDDVRSVFEKAQNSFGDWNRPRSSRSNPIPAADSDRRIKWTSTTDDVRLLHWSAEWEVKIYEYMQAIAFTGGTKHPTILVFESSVRGSESLQSDKYNNFVRSLRNRKDEHSRRKGVYSRDQSALAGQAPNRLTALEARVLRLEERVYELQGKSYRPQAAPLPPRFTAHQLKPSSNLKVVIAIASGTLLLAGVILLGVFYWPRG